MAFKVKSKVSHPKTAFVFHWYLTSRLHLSFADKEVFYLWLRGEIRGGTSFLAPGSFPPPPIHHSNILIVIKTSITSITCTTYGEFTSINILKASNLEQI